MVNFYARERVVPFGNSIVAYNFYQPLQDAITAYYTNLFGAGSPKIPVWFNAGVVADVVSQMYARIRGVDGCCPTLILNEGVLNDCTVGLNSGGATDNAAFATTYQNILTWERTQWPTARIACMTAFAWHEQWPSGANQYDKTVTGIEAKNAIVTSLAASNGCELIDMRAQYTALEPANNPNNLAVGPYLLDGVHPSLPGQQTNTPGQIMFSNTVMAHLTLRSTDVPINRPWVTS